MPTHLATLTCTLLLAVSAVGGCDCETADLSPAVDAALRELADASPDAMPVQDAATLDAAPPDDALLDDTLPDDAMASDARSLSDRDPMIRLDAEVVDAEVVDAEVIDAEVVDAQAIDAEVVDAQAIDAEAVDDPGARILFIGNSYTFYGPVPEIVDALANDAGWPDPHVDSRAFGGATLAAHRAEDSPTLALIDQGDWDVVVLQERSTGPTDHPNLGDDEGFKRDATWLHDRIKASSPDARVILFETWAWHAEHAIYRNAYESPADMQAQLRFHYFDAAERHIPENAMAPVEPPVVVAPVGDIWEAHLAEADPIRLHDDDDAHANMAGQYLSSLVIYSTIYDRAVVGRTPWQLDAPTAERLQDAVDGWTGRELEGGPFEAQE